MLKTDNSAENISYDNASDRAVDDEGEDVGELAAGGAVGESGVIL